jgi:hypothetical protein
MAMGWLRLPQIGQAQTRKKKKKKIVGRWGSRTTPNGHGVALAALDRPIWGG